MKIYVVTSNENKRNEILQILRIFSSEKFEFKECNCEIKEIQSKDIEEIVKNKSIRAFKKIGHPLIVEQTGLYIDDFGRLPGGLAQIFWDSLKKNGFCKYFTGKTVTAISMIAYCDGKEVHLFKGEIKGIISDKASKENAFAWDCVFQPDGFEKTLAELGEDKHKISMRKEALVKLLEFLEE